MRAAAVSFLTDYAAAASVQMQVYPGRPRTLMPPTGFVDLIRETVNHDTALTRREPIIEAIVVHALYDSKSAADQKDAYVDGLIEWAETRYHQAGANTMLGLTAVEDIPDYVPEWLPPAEQKTYYASRITLEGLGGV